VLVSRMSGALYQTNDLVNLLTVLKKHASLLYSVDSGISLSLKEVPKLSGSIPFNHRMRQEPYR
jgi:hypothetical protein